MRSRISITSRLRKTPQVVCTSTPNSPPPLSDQLWYVGLSLVSSGINWIKVGGGKENPYCFKNGKNSAITNMCRYAWLYNYLKGYTQHYNWFFFFTPQAPSRPFCSLKFQKMLSSAFQVNSTMSLKCTLSQILEHCDGQKVTRCVVDNSSWPGGFSSMATNRNLWRNANIWRQQLLLLLLPMLDQMGR